MNLGDIIALIRRKALEDPTILDVPVYMADSHEEFNEIRDLRVTRIAGMPDHIEPFTVVMFE